jgi:hypothetical protein
MTTRELTRFEHAARRALFRKELREERAAIIAGAVIFLGLPALWTGLYTLCGPRSEVFPGLATVLLLIGGWLFGAVVAAQSVCRDFGRAQGAFLLARPILPSDVIRAKAKAGLMVVGGVTLAVGLLELLLWSLARNSIDAQLSWGWWLAGALASVLAFWIAFAAAAITRQMLSGVMLAALALVLLITVPLVTTLPARLFTALAVNFLAWPARASNDVHARNLAYTFRELALPGAVCIAALFGLFRVILPRSHRPSLLWPVAAIGLLFCADNAFATQNINDLWGLVLLPLVGIATVLAYGIARRACRSQHVLRLGTKSIAWTIGLTMILLGTLAMTQVGANIRVTATCWHSDWNPARYGAHTSLAASSGHFAVGRAPDRLALYHIAADGQMTHSRFAAGPGQWGAHRRVPFFDAQERLFEVSSWPHGMRRLGGDIIAEQPIRVELAQVDMTVGVVGTPQRLQVPESIPPDADALVYDTGLTNDRLFLLYGYNGLENLHDFRTTTFAHVVLAVYDWRDGAATDLDRSFDLPGGAALNPRSWGCRLSRGVDGCLYAVTDSLRPINLSTPSLSELDRHAIVFGQDDLDWALPFPAGPQYAVISKRAGLFIVEFRDPPTHAGHIPTPTVRAVGELRASPWAWLFRADYPILVAAGPGRLWEVHDTSAICYDVSDPTHPRRIAHVTSYTIENAVAGPDYLLLDHGAGFSLVRNPP